MAENPLINDIYQQFIDYFGEDKVDLQKYTSRAFKFAPDYSREVHTGDNVILVHWPTVTVTNEYDESVEIWDLYAATVISPSGVLVRGPIFNRSTYDNIQWQSDYAHSHLSGINKSNIREFRRSCLGSGPINGTIHRLSEDGHDHEDLDIWNLYIWELDKYVHVESISGVPYRKIRNIGTNNGTSNSLRDFHVVCEISSLNSNIPKAIIKDIANILLENKVFSFNYYQGHYSIGMPFVDAVMKASNTFIEYYNSHPEFRKKYKKEQLFTKLVLQKLVLKGDMFYEKDNYNVPIEAIVNTELFTFKGHPVQLALRDFHAEYTAGEVIVINIEILSYIVYSMLKYINVKYGRTEDNIAEKARIV